MSDEQDAQKDANPEIAIRSFPRESSMFSLLSDRRELNSEIAANAGALPQVAQEGSPEAERLLQHGKRVAEDRNKLASMSGQSTKLKLARGVHAYHTKKKVDCICLEEPVNGKVRVLNTATRKEFTATVNNLVI